MVTGRKPDAGRAQSAMRQRNSWLTCRPALRATSEADTPGSNETATRRSFLAWDHRHRRSTDLITSTRDGIGLLLERAMHLSSVCAPV